MSEINVTPFVDVMLVLLIVFMVTAPLLTVGIKVDLPKVEATALTDIKDPIEIELIQRACDITRKGFMRILNFVKDGVWEYEIEAEFIHEFLKNRSKKFAYSPIIASGNNANILHYIENNKQCWLIP